MKKLRRGEIIWARVEYPRKWWPGLVSEIKGHLVAVSFFEEIKNAHYFLETEVCSFQENFESLVKTIRNSRNGNKLLDSALKLISTRVYSSLICSCQFFTSPRKKNRLKKDLFESDDVLGFVRDAAVSPFIGVSDLVHAVTFAAKINAFRRYAVGACSVARKSDALELEFAPLDEDQPNCRSLVEVKPTKTQSVHEMLVLLRCLALDTEYLSGECLNTVKQNVLIFRNLALQNTLQPNPIIERSSHSGQPNVIVDGNNCKIVFTALDPYEANSIKFLGSKRHVDHPVDSGSSVKLCKTLPLFPVDETRVYLEKREIANTVCVSDALISKPVSTDLSLKLCNTMTFAFINSTNPCLPINSTRCEANASDAFSSRSKLEVVMIDDASAGTRNYLSSTDSTTDQSQVGPSSGDHKTSVETKGKQLSIYAVFGDRSISINKLHAVVTRDASSKPKVQPQQSATGTFSDYQHLFMKFPKDFKLPSKNDLIRKFSRFGKVDSFRTKIYTNLGSARVVFSHYLDAMTAYQYAKRNKSLFGGARILFWVDPYEKKTRGPKYVAPLTNLKSCLKKSDRKHGQEDKQHTKKKVRFLIET